ncbi:MAG: hypothetical protein IMW88_12005 [Thermoflavifilum sp.]|uniref:hypothetical protein n=1 Tax=Thermoflavifilum sp. TaxID=1968839 RepID=UPI0018A4106C|nr:hypothetical protein [Thermoflavifilum sp.]QOR76000.1 MAG: hypothetical protein IMW88_12005 [Thermoflavifilum sp.]
MSIQAFRERLVECRQKVRDVKHPYELRQLLMHFFAVADAHAIREMIDKKLFDDLCSVYYSLEAAELFSEPHVKAHLCNICIDRTLIIFEEMIQQFSLS